MAKDTLHFKMIDCNDILVYRIIDVWYRNIVFFLAMVTFQNTEQRHKKYIKQTIIDKFKVVFL
jgi:hypothetical protein